MALETQSMLNVFALANGRLVQEEIDNPDTLARAQPVWVDLEKRLAQVPSTNPARQRFLDRVNFYGQVAELDAQGRVVIHPRLRDSAQITGEVDVLGQQSYLEVWNHDRLVAKLAAEPFTDEDAKALSDFGI